MQQPGSYPCTVVATALIEALTMTRIASIAYQTVNNLSTTNQAGLVTLPSASTYANRLGL